ncbi:MAG: tetratricopeptide repeat protein [Rubrivivax sp.]|nr:tetratricopeptide repeat protein [Rubrivivax sp.]
MNHYHEPVKLSPTVRALLLGLAVLGGSAAQAADPPSAPGRPAVLPASGMDALLFYQLLIGEIELQNGRSGVAVEVLLDAARRSRDEQLFQRAVEVALQARSGDQAVAVARAWRSALPESLTALRYQVQILAALGRVSDAADPVRALLARSTGHERSGIMASLPRLFVRGTDARVAAEMIEQAVQPYAGPNGPRDVALVTAGRAWLMAGDDAKALARARDAAQADPRAPGPVLLALELMQRDPAAEPLVKRHLEAADSEPAVRLAYVRVLTQQQRLGEAAVQLERVTQQQPDNAQPWLTLGAVHLELKHPQDAERALNRYIELQSRPPQAGAEADDDAQEAGDNLIQARLMLAQAAEQRKDFAAAEQQLALITAPERAADVQSRRASLLVRQGQWRKARELIRALPEQTPAQARSKVMSEAQVLREARQWREAYTVLAKGFERFPDDTDLIYEQAMVAEKLDRLDDMERLLRRVIAMKPDHQHAYNALGYSLADRGLRLDEARELIRKALALAPGDPFITDSLGWVEFRLGRKEEALRLLRQAYGARPDTEIAAHLGEVLWTLGQRDEARRIWAEGRQRDAENEVLRETLTRLKPGL